MPSDRPPNFDIPLSDFDLGLLPPAARTIGSDAFDDAVLMHFMGQYADKGINAAVSVDDRAIHVALIPEHPRSLLDHAVTLMREGRLANGIDILEWLRENTGPDADVLYNLGIARSERGQLAEAIEALTACTALDAGYVDAWTGLGVAYQRLDRPVRSGNQRSAPGEEFTGLQLISMMHAGVRQFQKDADTGADFEAEYAMALSMSGEGKAGAA